MGHTGKAALGKPGSSNGPDRMSKDSKFPGSQGALCVFQDTARMPALLRTDTRAGHTEKGACDLEEGSRGLEKEVQDAEEGLKLNA